MEKNRVLPIRNLLQLSSKRSGKGLQPYRLSVIVIMVVFGLRWCRSAKMQMCGWAE